MAKKTITYKEVKKHCLEGGDTPSGSSTLAELTDVELTDVDDGEVLVYDETSEKWVNGVVESGDAVNVLNYVGTGGDNTLEFSEKPRIILGIGGEALEGKHVVSRGSVMVCTYRTRCYGDWYRSDDTHGGDISCMVYWDEENSCLKFTDSSSNDAKYNEVDCNYTLYYV